MLTVLKNILGVLFIVGLIFLVTNYSGFIKEQIGVKGASTDRAKEVSGKIGDDLSGNIDSVMKQVLEVKVSDLVNGFSRAQKIPQDFKKSEQYVRKQIDNMVKSKNN